MNSLHPPVTEPSPGPPPPHAPRRWGWLAAALVAVGTTALMLWYLQPLVELLHRTGQRLAGLGALQWADASGEWHSIAPADAARITWSPETAFLQPGWTAIAPGLETAEIPFARPPHPQTVPLALVRLQPEKWRMRTVGYPDWVEHPVADFADTWRFTLAVNASFFSSEGPIGLVVQDGKVRHRQASRKAAHFLIDTPGGRIRIVNHKMTDIAGINGGFQGFPAMMSGGKLYSYVVAGGRGFDVFTVDRRTAACTDRDGRLLLMVTDSLTNGLSFAELGIIMGGLGCVDGMAFDGGSSTALELRVKGHERHIVGVKPVQVVLGISRI